MAQAATYVPERLDHLGIVAGVCQEIGLAGYLAWIHHDRLLASVGR